MRFFFEGELSIMPLPKYQLFLGFPMDDVFLESFEQIDEKVQNFFVREDDQYLQKVTNASGTIYLGKFIGDKTDLEELHDIEANIYSLLKRIAPDYPFHQTPLRLFPAKEKNPALI